MIALIKVELACWLASYLNVVDKYGARPIRENNVFLFYFISHFFILFYFLLVFKKFNEICGTATVRINGIIKVSSV